MPRLLLVRHGESEWNADGRWQGQADPPLSELGRHQARNAALHVGAVDAIVASPLERAHVTAATISEALGVGPVLVEPDLMERHAGEWQGLTRAEIEAQYPGYLDGHGPDRPRPPGWEHEPELLARVLGVIERIATDLAGADDLLVVTHGGCIYAVERHLGAAIERIPNLGGRELHVEPGPGGRLVLGERLLLVDPDAVEVTQPRMV